MIVYADISAFQAGIDISALPGPNPGRPSRQLRPCPHCRRHVPGREWPRHRDEARRVGKQPVAYHYIGETVSPAWRLDQTLRWIGAPPGEIPIMVDWEAWTRPSG